MNTRPNSQVQTNALADAMADYSRLQRENDQLREALNVAHNQLSSANDEAARSIMKLEAENVIVNKQLAVACAERDKAFRFAEQLVTRLADVDAAIVSVFRHVRDRMDIAVRTAQSMGKTGEPGTGSPDAPPKTPIVDAVTGIEDEIGAQVERQYPGTDRRVMEHLRGSDHRMPDNQLT